MTKYKVPMRVTVIVDIEVDACHPWGAELHGEIQVIDDGGDL